MIAVENVIHSRAVKYVDSAMHESMERAFLKVPPETSPALTAEELQELVVAHLPEEPFPAGVKAGWWAKSVQLGLGAKAIVAREKPKPLR